MAGELYSRGLGSALGSGLAQGVQAFTDRTDFLDQKNYDRAQAAMINKKKDAELLYNHLGSMLTDFGKMQLAGGQDKLSPLQLAQAQDAESKVKKIQGLLTSGKYDEGMKAYEDFQAHMNQVEGPKPSDTDPNMAGPGQGVMENGLDTLNNQTNRGNQLLGALALKGTQLDVKGKEIAVDLSAEQLAQVKQTSASTIAALNATNGVQVATAKIFTDLAEFNSTAQKAAYLKTISESGAAGAALVDGLNLPPSLAAAVKKQAENVQTTQDNAAKQSTTDLQTSQWNLQDLKDKAPMVYRGMELANQLSEGGLMLQGAQLAQAEQDLIKGQQQIDQNDQLFPDQKALLHNQLDLAQSQLEIQKATQAGTIASTDATNWGNVAKLGKDPAFFDQLVKDKKMTPEVAAMYKKLAQYTADFEKAQLTQAQNAATKSGVDARVAVKTEGDQVLGVHYQTNLLGTNAAAARNDLEYQDRNNKIGVQMKRAALVGQNHENTISGEQARTAGPLADAQLQIAQGQGKTAFSAGMHAYALDDAAVKKAQADATTSAANAAEAPAQAKAQTTILLGQGKLIGAQAEVAQQTIGTAVQTATASLNSILLDNTGKGISNEFETKAMGAKLNALTLGNKLTTANIGQVYQQIMTMKQERQQAKIKFPKDLAALDAALEYTKAQANKLALESSAGNDVKSQISILQQQRIINDGDLKDAQLGIARFIPNAKFGVDQFDPSNYSTMTAKLSVEQKADLKKAVDQYNQVMKDRKSIQGALSTLGTSLTQPAGGNGKPSVTGSGDGRVMTAPAGFKAQTDPVAAKIGINPAGFYAFLGAESAFGTNTKNYKNMDYVGVGQIGQAAMDDVNKTFGTNLNRNVPEDNMELAARYYKLLSKRLGTQDPAMIYAAYNWGIGNLQKHLAANGGKLNISATPAETQTGLANVAASYRGYSKDGAPTPTPKTPAGTPQPASQTTKPPANVPLQKGQFKSSGGGVYSSPTIEVPQWKRLDKEGFFKQAAAADKVGPDAVKTLLIKYGTLLWGSPTPAQLNSLGAVVDQIGGH